MRVRRRALTRNATLASSEKLVHLVHVYFSIFSGAKARLLYQVLLVHSWYAPGTSWRYPQKYSLSWSPLHDQAYERTDPGIARIQSHT